METSSWNSHMLVIIKCKCKSQFVSASTAILLCGQSEECIGMNSTRRRILAFNCSTTADISWTCFWCFLNACSTTTYAILLHKLDSLYTVMFHFAITVLYWHYCCILMQRSLWKQHLQTFHCDIIALLFWLVHPNINEKLKHLYYDQQHLFYRYVEQNWEHCLQKWTVWVILAIRSTSKFPIHPQRIVQMVGRRNTLIFSNNSQH